MNPAKLSKQQSKNGCAHVSFRAKSAKNLGILTPLLLDIVTKGE